MQGCFFGFLKLAMGMTIVMIAITLTPGCSTTPKAEDQGKVLADGREAMDWFANNVSGLDRQLDRSAGYIVYPGVGQYGL